MDPNVLTALAGIALQAIIVLAVLFLILYLVIRKAVCDGIRDSKKRLRKSRAKQPTDLLMIRNYLGAAGADPHGGA